MSAVARYSEIQTQIAMDTARTALETAWRELGAVSLRVSCSDADHETLRRDRAKLRKMIALLH